LKKYHREYKTNDIEILLTRLDLDILHPKAKKQAALQTVRKIIEQQLAEYFAKYRFRGEILDKGDWLKDFVGLFDRGDTIVALNYDCLLEGVLDYYKVWSPKGGYAVLDHSPLWSSDNAKDIRIFKIHGSEHFKESPGWPDRNKTSIGFALNESIYPRSGKNTHFDYGDLESRPYIIAPSFVKVPHQDIELMMIEALKAAATAVSFIIIGCGMRPEDSFLWLLLTTFLNQPLNHRTLVIVDPLGEKVGERIVGHYFADIKESITIKTLAKGIQHATPELFAELHGNPN